MESAGGMSGECRGGGRKLSGHFTAALLLHHHRPCARRHGPCVLPSQAFGLIPRTFCSATTGLRADTTDLNALPLQAFGLISTDLNALPPQAFGLTSGKGGLVRLGCRGGELLLLVRAFRPVQRRRTDAVLLLRRTAALVGPAGPFPPIRPKARHGIALSVGQPSLNSASRRVFRGTTGRFLGHSFYEPVPGLVLGRGPGTKSFKEVSDYRGFIFLSPCPV